MRLKRNSGILWHLQVALSSIPGTTVMTLFSYLLSEKKHKNFREPDLLDKLFHRLVPAGNKKQSHSAGWLLHYLTGVLFAEAYTAFWSDDAKKNMQTGLVLGGISGFAAILIWKFVFTSHPNPPAVDFIGFAAQLFVAHLLFGVFAAFGYNIIRPARKASTTYTAIN